MEKFSFALDERIKEVSIKDDQIKQLETDIMMIKSEFNNDNKIVQLEKERLKLLEESKTNKNVVMDLKVLFLK